MCRGSYLGTCCEQGCDQRISCQDTGGYCNAHDPHDWDGPPTNVADDPEKRRVYNHSRVTLGIRALEASIRADRTRLDELRDRLLGLTAGA